MRHQQPGPPPGRSAFLSDWRPDDAGNVQIISVRAEHGGGAPLRLVTAFACFQRCGFVCYPFHQSLSLPPWLFPSAYSSVVARSAHCRIQLIGKRSEGKNGIKVHWHAAAIRCTVKSLGGKCLAASCRWKNEAHGNFFPVWKSRTPVIVCSCGVQGGLVARQDQSFVLIPWAENRQTEGDGTSEPLYQDLIYFPKQFSVFMRLRKCGGSKITVINWNSECASMALIIRRSSISLMSL